MDGISNLWPLNPSCLGASVNGTEIGGLGSGGGDSVYALVVNDVVLGAWPGPTLTTGLILSREILKSSRLF